MGDGRDAREPACAHLQLPDAQECAHDGDAADLRDRGGLLRQLQQLPQDQGGRRQPAPGVCHHARGAGAASARGAARDVQAAVAPVRGRVLRRHAAAAASVVAGDPGAPLDGGGGLRQPGPRQRQEGGHGAAAGRQQRAGPARLPRGARLPAARLPRPRPHPHADKRDGQEAGASGGDGAAHDARLRPRQRRVHVSLHGAAQALPAWRVARRRGRAHAGGPVPQPLRQGPVRAGAPAGAALPGGGQEVDQPGAPARGHGVPGALAHAPGRARRRGLLPGQDDAGPG
mmetsp:Transcript_55114/g.145488  ORF Transcript_55114/g.145488 Transcript_55114/m.145488 type:complete len:286 (+) Transcript_55114:2902-3759(+)